MLKRDNFLEKLVMNLEWIVAIIVLPIFLVILTVTLIVSYGSQEIFSALVRLKNKLLRK